MPEFRHRTELDHSPEDVFGWHCRPGAFERLAPPWLSVRVVSRTGGLAEGSKVSLSIRRGPVEVPWELRHTAYEEGERFVDEQIRGPFGSWRHEHLFEPLPGGRTAIVDVVRWEPPLGSLGERLTEGYGHSELGRAFSFRARRLRSDLSLFHRYGLGEGRVVAITGSTGLIGTALTALLSTGGYRVLRISRGSRDSSGPHEQWIRWDPTGGVLDPAALEGGS